MDFHALIYKIIVKTTSISLNKLAEIQLRLEELNVGYNPLYLEHALLEVVQIKFLIQATKLA